MVLCSRQQLEKWSSVCQRHINTRALLFLFLDVVDMILAMCGSVAVPAILFGCEMIPFSESAICEIERV